MKGNHTGGGQGAVQDRTARRPDVAEVVTHSPPAFHQLHLFLVDLHDAPVGISIALVPDHKAIGEAGYLKVVPDPGHGGSLGHNVFESLHQIEQFIFAQGIGIFLFDAPDLGGQPPVHVIGGEFIEGALGILQSIFIHPDPAASSSPLKYFSEA
jgi:hypothetical protein